MVYQNEKLSVPSIKWLGVYPSDIISLNLQSTSLTDLDQMRIKYLLKKSYINSNNELLQQVPITLYFILLEFIFYFYNDKGPTGIQ